MRWVIWMYFTLAPNSQCGKYCRGSRTNVALLQQLFFLQNSSVWHSFRWSFKSLLLVDLASEHTSHGWADGNFLWWSVAFGDRKNEDLWWALRRLKCHFVDKASNKLPKRFNLVAFSSQTKGGLSKTSMSFEMTTTTEQKGCFFMGKLHRLPLHSGRFYWPNIQKFAPWLGFGLSKYFTCWLIVMDIKVFHAWLVLLILQIESTHVKVCHVWSTLHLLNNSQVLALNSTRWSRAGEFFKMSARICRNGTRNTLRWRALQSKGVSLFFSSQAAFSLIWKHKVHSVVKF